MATSIFFLEPEHGVGCATTIKGVTINKIEYNLEGEWVICPANYLNITRSDKGTRIENVSPLFLHLKVSF